MDGSGPSASLGMTEKVLGMTVGWDSRLPGVDCGGAGVAPPITLGPRWEPGKTGKGAQDGGGGYAHRKGVSFRAR